MNEREELADLNGVEWHEAVKKIWEANRSRFGTAWDDMPHHDQVSIYRVLLAQGGDK